MSTQEMPTLIQLSPDMKLSDIPSKPDKKYLLLMKGAMVFVACCDNLSELEGALHERNLTFDPVNAKLYEMPGDTDMQAAVEDIGEHLDRLFGFRGERYVWKGPN